MSKVLIVICLITAIVSFSGCEKTFKKIGEGVDKAAEKACDVHEKNK